MKKGDPNTSVVGIDQTPKQQFIVNVQIHEEAPQYNKTQEFTENNPIRHGSGVGRTCEMEPQQRQQTSFVNKPQTNCAQGLHMPFGPPLTLIYENYEPHGVTIAYHKDLENSRMWYKQINGHLMEKVFKVKGPPLAVRNCYAPHNGSEI